VRGLHVGAGFRLLKTRWAGPEFIFLTPCAEEDARLSERPLRANSGPWQLWWTGSIFQQRQFPVVTVVVADGRVYTVEEFAKTMVNVQAA
jgi:hypothetical protein